MDMCQLSMLLRLERSCRFDEKEIVHQWVFQPSLESMIENNPQESIIFDCADSWFGMGTHSPCRFVPMKNFCSFTWFAVNNNVDRWDRSED